MHILHIDQFPFRRIKSPPNLMSLMRRFSGRSLIIAIHFFEVLSKITPIDSPEPHETAQLAPQGPLLVQERATVIGKAFNFKAEF